MLCITMVWFIAAGMEDGVSTRSPDAYITIGSYLLANCPEFMIK